MKLLRYLPLLPVLTFGLWACGDGGGSTAPTSSPSGDSGKTSGVLGDPAHPSVEGGNTANFPFDHMSRFGNKDAFLPLTDPPFVGPNDAAAAYLRDDDLVLGLVINGEARAYPHNIGWQHEIVNDIVGSQPVVVSFCPLTGTSLAFNGAGEDGSRITAGVSGLLVNNNLILYDRRDSAPETLYPQMIFRGISGPRAGEDLRLLPGVETTWRYWKKIYPDTRVVGADKDLPPHYYREYPYLSNRGDYRSPDFPPFYPLSPTWDENPTARLYSYKDLVLGVRFAAISKAYPFLNLGEGAVINDTVDSAPIVVVWYRREQLAISYFRDVGIGPPLTFEKVASADPVYPFLLKDKETGTTWNLKGEAIAGEFKGKGLRLEQVPAHRAFWFAWATFWPNTEVYTP